MFEHRRDQLGGADGSLSGREYKVCSWSQLVRKFKLSDTFAPVRGHLRFNWDSMRLHKHNPINGSSPSGTRMLRRLDQIYVADSPSNNSLGCTSTILPGFAFSDHAPVVAKMTPNVGQRRPSIFWMNPSHFTNPVYKDHIKNMWTATLHRGELYGWTPLLSTDVLRMLARSIVVGGNILPVKGEFVWICCSTDCRWHN